MNKCTKRATQKDIEDIRQTYIQCKSIEKTVKETGWSRNTVHKYVSDLSCEHPSSSYNHRHVLKLDRKTGKVIMDYQDLATAAKLSKVSISNIDHCIKGNTKTAGGFCWIYKDQYKEGEFKPPSSFFYSESKFIDRLLFLGGN